MSQERKKVDSKPVVKPAPVKRERPQPVVEPKAEVKAKPKPEPKVKAEVKPKPKAEVKPVKIEPKPKVAVNKVDNHRKVEVETEVDDDLVKEIRKNRPKSDDKYVRYSSKDYQGNKVIISEKLLKGEMKFAYFAIDGDDFYHYYILIKK
jgi:hypothetical protein